MIISSKIIGQGPVVIILHGLFGEGRNWLSVANELQSNFEVHLIDQRNHGNSFHHFEHNYLVLAEDLYNYIKAKELTNVSIIGHSMGGKTAMNFACIYPDLLSKLIIIDIAPKSYQDDHSQIFKGLNDVIKNSHSRKEAYSIFMNYVDDSVMTNFLLKGLYFSENNKAQLKFNLPILERSIKDLLGFVALQSTFNKVVYFLSGSKSDYINDLDSQSIAKIFPVYEIVNIKNAGHWIHVDQKEYFVNTINKILK